MERAEILQNEIKKVLSTVWDPIGIVDVSAASDEYDRYVVGVMRALLQKASVEALSKHLLKIEREDMGLSGNESKALLAANRLRELYP